MQSSGISLALTSRLLPKSSFEEAASRSALTDALFTAETATPGATLMMTTPASFPGDGKTSVTEAWRSSLFHVTLIKTWNWSATPAEKRQHFQAASSSIDNLRKITPDAAYVVRISSCATILLAHLVIPRRTRQMFMSPISRRVSGEPTMFDFWRSRTNSKPIQVHRSSC